jgi:hypothetical protein
MRPRMLRDIRRRHRRHQETHQRRFRGPPPATAYIAFRLFDIQEPHPAKIGVTQGMASIRDVLATTTAPEIDVPHLVSPATHAPPPRPPPSMFNAMLLELLMGRLACICSGQVVQHKRIHIKRNEGRKLERSPSQGSGHCPPDEPPSSPLLPPRTGLQTPRLFPSPSPVIPPMPPINVKSYSAHPSYTRRGPVMIHSWTCHADNPGEPTSSFGCAARYVVVRNPPQAATQIILFFPRM